MAKKNNGLAGILKFLIIVGIIVVAAVTCPDEKAHKQAVKEAVRKECIREGLPIGGGVIGSLATLAVTSTDCIVFSLGFISDGDGSELASVGLFGKVFVIPGTMSGAV